MAYKLVKDVFLDGEVKLAGSEVDIKDQELAKALLERGSVVESSQDVPQRLTAFESAQVESQAADQSRLDQEARDSQAQAEAKQQLAGEQEVPSVEAPLEATPEQPSQPSVPEQPTPDQIREDLASLDVQ